MPPHSPNKDDATNSRLDTVIKLLAAMYARELNNNDAIVKLDKMQLSREQIAEAVGVNTHNVSQVLYASKKAGEMKAKQGDAVAKPEVVEAAATVEASQQ